MLHSKTALPVPWLPAPWFPALWFLALFPLTRMIVSALGIAPDPDVVLHHWQHADLQLLASDPFGTLWNLQAQPPLWNGVLAIAVALVGPEGGAVTNAIHGFHGVLSAGAGLLILSMLRAHRFPPLLALAFALAAVCSPTVIYFENISFYPHFTFFLVALLVWLLLRIKRQGAIWPVASALGVLVLLSWTWALFHPAFVALFGAALVLWSRGWTRASRPAFAFVALACVASSLPTLKNAIMFGLPSASGWIGLNLAQTVPGGQSGDLVGCDFAIAHRHAILDPSIPKAGLHPALTQAWKSSGEPNFNHIGLIDRSKQCLALSKDAILHDLPGWTMERIAALLGSHQVMSSDYDVDPLGWDNVMGPMERLHDQLGFFGRAGMILWYIGLWWFAAKGIRNNPPLYLHLILFMAFFTLTAHLLNGGEQARMRYTIEPIYVFLTAGALAAALRGSHLRQGSLLKANA